MSFFHKKMSQNFWTTIMTFGPVTNFLLAQKYFFGPALISSTDMGYLYEACDQISDGFKTSHKVVSSTPCRVWDSNLQL